MQQVQPDAATHACVPLRTCRSISASRSLLAASHTDADAAAAVSSRELACSSCEPASNQARASLHARGQARSK